jgi:hypothetical protein
MCTVSTLYILKDVTCGVLEIKLYNVYPLFLSLYVHFLYSTSMLCDLAAVKYATVVNTKDCYDDVCLTGSRSLFSNQGNLNLYHYLQQYCVKRTFRGVFFIYKNIDY